MRAKVQLGDIGTVFTLTVYKRDDPATVEDLSGATVEVIFRKPGSPRTVVTRSADLATDGTDGKVTYKTVSGDIDKVGQWEVQTKATFDADNVFYSDPGEFDVELM